MPYVYKKRFLDTQYGMRKDGGIFNIADSAVLVNQDSKITIKEQEFRNSEGLWELLTRNGVNKEHVTSDDLRTYKKILLLTNSHLEDISPNVSLMSAEGKSSAKSSPLFSQKPKHGCRIRITSRLEKIVSCPLTYYITILPSRRPSRSWRR